jgi:AcrR family transcriptional regulator
LKPETGSNKTPRSAKEVVLDSAIQEFAHKGYSGTSVQDILKATGLSKPTLYYYFQSKAGLYRAIMDFAYDECLSRMQDRVAKAEGGIREKLLSVTMAMFEFAEKRPQLLRLVFASNFAAPEEIPAECVDKEKRRRNFDFVKDIVEESVKARELDGNFSAVELAHGLYGAISHHVRLHLLCGEGKLNARVAARLVDLFLHGAKAR